MSPIPFPWDCLTFSGGGTKALCHVGALLELEELTQIPVLRWLRGVSGCSSGAFIATALAAGFAPAEIHDFLMKELDFSAVMRRASRGNVLTKICRLFSAFGMMDNTVLGEHIDRMLEDKWGVHNMTFAQLFEKTGIELAMNATSMRTRSSVYFSSTLTPDEIVSYACMASMAFPFFFLPIKTVDNDLLNDGGITENLPTRYFGRRTLAFNIEHCVDRPSPQTLHDYMALQGDIITDSATNLMIEHHHGEENVVRIRTFPSNALQAELTRREKWTMVVIGRECLRNFLTPLLSHSIVLPPLPKNSFSE